MPLKVQDASGRTVAFDRDRLARYLERTFALTRPVALRVASTIRQVARAEIGSTIAAADLPALAGRVLGRAANARLGRTGGLMLTPTLADPGGAFALLGSALEFLLSRLGDQGFEEDGKGCLRRERIGFLPPFDDQKAPEIRNIEATNPRCCESPMGQKGIGFDLRCEVTDTGGVGNSSGCKNVRVCGVSVASDGSWFLGPCGDYPLSEEEVARSEDGWVAVTVTLCVDCAFVRDGVLPVMVQVTDDDDNDRICLTRVPFGDALRARCCA